MFKKNNNKIYVRSVVEKDVNEIMRVEKTVWPEEMCASREMILARIKTFPEGFLCVIKNGEMVGFVCSEIIYYKDTKKKGFNWYNLTDNGYILKSHNPLGDTLYGIDLSILPQNNITLAAKLLEGYGKLTIKKRLKRIIFGARIPRYYKYAKNMSPEKYVFTRTKRGSFLDPELAFYQTIGTYPVRIIKNYFGDKESLDYGVLVTWKNPYYKVTKLFPFLADLLSKMWRIKTYKAYELFKVGKKNMPFNIDQIEFDKIDKGLLQKLFNSMNIRIAYTMMKYDNFLKKPVLNATLFLPGKGCTWAKERNGGCSMCGFKNALPSVGINRILTDSEILHIFDLGLSMIEKEHPTVLNIYNGGSFLSNSEISYETQDAIVKKIKNNKDIKTLFIESRPEFISLDRLQTLTRNLRPVFLKIGIGLEAVTDKIRNDYINKGMSRESYEKAIRAAEQVGAKILTYIFIKPIFLSEEEAIEEAVKTTKYAFGVGSDEVSFESACIQKGTRMEELYNEGKYRPPWLWSIIEIIKITYKLGNIQIGTFWDFPLPIAKPYNCQYCSSRVEKLFDQYRINHDIAVFDGVDCQCRSTWKQKIKEKSKCLSLHYS